MMGASASGSMAPRHDAEPDPHKRQKPDLREIDGEDRARLRTQRLERGDGRDLAVEIGPDGGGHADAAHRKASQPHQHQERADPVDELLHAGRAVARIAPAHAGVGEQIFGLRLQRGQFGAIGQRETVLRVE
jgi:hypothetical protein